MALLQLTCAYGPAFLAAILPSHEWIEEAAQTQRLAELEAYQQAVEREIAAIRHQARTA